MSDLKLCQGPNCHQYHTQDRLKGPKGIKLIKLEEEVVFIMGIIISVQ